MEQSATESPRVTTLSEPRTPMTPESRGFDLVRACEILFAVAVLFAALSGMQRGWIDAHRPYQVDYEEGNVLNAALQITHGGTPYGAPHAWPKVLNTYGPVTYYLAAIPVKLFGADFTGPRLIVVFFTFLCALFLTLLIQQQTKSWLIALIFGPLLLSIGNVRTWMALLRVDLIGLAFSLGGLYVFCRYPKRWWLAALLFCAALYSKHSLLAAPAACAIWYLTQKDWRGLLKFSGTLAAMGAVVMLVFDRLTSGAFSFALLRTYNHAYYFQVYVQMMRDELTGAGLLVIFALVGAGAVIAQRRGSAAIYCFALSPLAALTAGKVGSNTNHMLEFNAMLCFGGALGWAAASAACRKHRYLVPVMVAASVLFTLALLRNMQAFAPEAGIACLDARNFVHSYPGTRMLSDNIGLLVLAGKPVFLSNPFVYAQLVERDGWSDKDLEEMVIKRNFDLIILGRFDDPPQPGDRWSPAVAHAIGENYRPIAQFACRDASMMWAPRLDMPGLAPPGH